MKHNLIKYYFTLIFFCTSLMLFAAPGNNNETNDLENTDAPVPIDDYIGIVATMGVLFVFMKLNEVQIKKRVLKQKI